MDISKIQTRATQKEKRFDIRGKELYIGDIVAASMNSGSIAPYVITEFTPRALRLANINCTKSDYLYFGEVLRITDMLDEYELKNYEFIRNLIIKNKTTAKQTRIIEKTIMYLIYDRYTHRYGLYPTKIVSRPGKTIGKNDMKLHFEELRQKHPNFDFYAMKSDFQYSAKNEVPTYCFTWIEDLFKPYYFHNSYEHILYFKKKPEKFTIQSYIYSSWRFSKLHDIISSFDFIFESDPTENSNKTICFAPDDNLEDWQNFYIYTVQFINESKYYAC